MNELLERTVYAEEPVLIELADKIRDVKHHNFFSNPTTSSAKYRHSFFVNILKLADIAALLAAATIGYMLRFGLPASLSPSANLFVYLSSFITIVSLYLARSYSPRTITSLSAQLNTLFVGGMGATFAILVCGFFSGTLRDYSRIWILATFLIAAILLFLNRIAISRFARSAVKNRTLIESIAIVGANTKADKMISALLTSPPSEVSILGVFDDRRNRPMPPLARSHLIGTTNDLLEFVRNHRVDRVVVTLPWIASDRINQLLKKLRTVPVRIDLVPSDVVWQFPTIEMERLGGIPVLTVANGRISEQSGVMKRLEDIVLSGLLLLLASPILLLIALAIKLDSKGPVLFRQKRHGFNNKVFDVYKFRSMKVMNADVEELRQATRDDPRVTRVGRFLRRSSLDELPQLFNVLWGHMSIVGPRPHAVQHNHQYADIILEYFARHNVKPGITGWAQVNGLRGETDTEDKMRRRVDYDLHYIEHWSLLFDLKILLMTSVAVWFQDTAY